MAQPTPVAGPPRPLADQEVVTIGRRQFLVGEVIGEGAYARVWSARSANQEEAAIKEMRCGQGPGILPDASLQRAIFEVEVMQRLASEDDNLPGAKHCEVSAPRVLEHQFWQLGPSTPNAFLCRVAMTRRPGKPLGAWFDARAARKAACGPPRGDEDEVMMYLSSFLDAACVARALLAQLSPTFEKLNSSIAVHRDVNARNLLVHSPADSDPEDNSAGAAPSDASLLEFSVVDFGSSTDAKAWLGTGEGSWHMENPTGDARYWGPANWVRFLGGAQALSQEPGLMRIYSRRLDMFALAICALQVLLELHTRECPSEQDLGDTHGERGSAVHMVHTIQQVRSSWSSYWTIAVRSFDRLAEYSRLVCCGEQQRAAQLWQELSSGCIPQMLGQTLHELCLDLVGLSELCQVQRGGNGNSSWVQVGQTLSALRDMAHDDSSIDWAELSARVGPPVRRRPGEQRSAAGMSGPGAVGSTSVEAEPGPPQTGNSVVTSAAGGGASVVTAAAAGGASISTSAAPSPQKAAASTSLASRMMPGHPLMQQPPAMMSAPRATPSGGTAPAVQMRLVAEISGNEAASGHLAAPVQQQPPQMRPGAMQEADLPRQSREGTEAEPYEEAVGAEVNGATTPSMRMPQAVGTGAAQQASSAAAAGEELGAWGLSDLAGSKEMAGSGRRLPGIMPSSAFSPGIVTPPSMLQQPQQPQQAAENFVGSSESPPLTPLALSQLRNQQGMPLQERYPQESAERRSRSVAPLSNPQSPGEEREHEALRILRQVESEVRTLKRWYTEAIEAMRSPPFPAWGSQPPQPGSPVYGMGPAGPPGSDSAAGAAAAAAAAAVAAQLPGIAGTSLVTGPNSTAGGANVVPTPPVGYLQGPMPMGPQMR